MGAKSSVYLFKKTVMAKDKISLVTNVSANDRNRIRLIFPHWLKVFGGRIADFSVVLDRIQPTGRLADHGDAVTNYNHDQ